MLMMAGLSPMMLLSTFISDRTSGRKEHAEASAGASTGRRRAWRRSSSTAAARRSSSGAPSRPTPASWPSGRAGCCPSCGSAGRPTATSSTCASASPTSRASSAIAFGQGGDPALRGQGRGARRALPRGAGRARARAARRARRDRPGRPRARRRLARALDRRAARDAAQPARRRRRGRAVDRARRDAGAGWAGCRTRRAAASPLRGSHVVGRRSGRRTSSCKAVATLARERREEDAGRVRARAGAAGRRSCCSSTRTSRRTARRVDELLDGCAEVDIAVVWLARERRDVPGGCGAIVELAADRAAADVTWAASGQRVTGASADGMSRGDRRGRRARARARCAT